MASAVDMAGHVCLVAVYLALNSSLNMINRYVLGIYGFAFPMLLTICHMLFGFVALFVPVLLARRPAVHRQTWRRQWRGFLCVGCFMAMNIGLNNVSLVSLPLSLNQVLRASLPVVTAIVAVFVESKKPSRNEALALMCLTGGVCITIFEGKAMGNLSGLALAIAGVLCAAGMMSTAGKVLSEKLDVVQLTFYTAPISCTVLFPFFIAREWERFRVYAQDNGTAALLIILLSSIIALAYNLVHNFLLQRTSSVTVTVLGEVKIVGLLVLSALFLPGERNHLNTRMMVGVVTAIAGFCMYSNAKLLTSQRVDERKLTMSSAASNVIKVPIERLESLQHAHESPRQSPNFMAMEKVVVQRSEGGSRRSVSPVRGGVLMQAVSRLTAEQRDRGAAAVVRQGSGDVACLLRSRPSSPARQGREYEAMWERPAPADYGLHQQRPDRAPLSLDAPKPRSPLGPHNGPAPHSPSHAKAPSGGPLASVRPGRQQALGAAADPPSPEGLAWKADASLPASLRGPDTPPGAISEASLARSSSGGEACSSPDPGLAEEVQGPECGEAPCQHHRQLPGQWGVVDTYRPIHEAAYPARGQCCSEGKEGSQKVVMGMPLGVLTWARTR